jgi:hypothetical protein
MADSSSNIDLISSSQAQKEVTANGFFDAASNAALFGRRASTTTGLTFGLYGGKILLDGVITAISNTTALLTANTTNYLEANPTTGAITANTSGFTTGAIPLYQVVTGPSTITSYTDKRAFVVPMASPSLSKSTTGGTTTLTDAENNSDIIKITGTLVSNAIIILKNVKRSFIVENNTTGNFTVQFKTAAGTGPVIAQGRRAIVYVDGTNAILATWDRDQYVRISKSVAGGSNVTLSTLEAEYNIIELTGIITANINVIVPAINRPWIFNNATTGAFTVTVKTAAGTGVEVTQGMRAFLYADSTNVLDVSSGGGGAGGLNWLGAYSGATQYAIDDAVSYNGSSYIAKAVPPLATVPTNATYWDVLAAKGDAGTNGTNGTNGDIVWKGAYSGATAYVVNDTVEYQGSSYVCVSPTTGNAPPNLTYWNLVAAKGTDGAGGATVGDAIAFAIVFGG